MRVVPTALAVNAPEELTSATAGLRLRHEKGRPLRIEPEASLAWATSEAVWSKAVKEIEVGEAVTEIT